MRARDSRSWRVYESDDDDDVGTENTAFPATVLPVTNSNITPSVQPQSTAPSGRPSASATATPQKPPVNVHAETLRALYSRMHPYQRELFRASALQDSLVFLQTGGGKTWVAAALTLLHLAVHPASRVFFVVRTVALAAQQANVLEKLTDTPVACVANGAKQFPRAVDFCSAASQQHRVAVIVDNTFFKWLSEEPRLVTGQLATLVILDEVHHAQSGPYEKICKQLHDLRDGKPVQWAGGAAAVDAEAGRWKKVLKVGLRSAGATVLSSQLRHAVEVERTLYVQDDSGGGVDVRVASPVLELLISHYPRDMQLPQLVGLSASPVVHFNNTQRELVKLYLITRCRLVGVVEEKTNLRAHLPNPAIMALSYLPMYEERVLQTALRRVMTQVFRRMEALVPEGSARKKLDTVRTTSVVSPGFAASCRSFETDTAMSDKFKKVLSIPPGSVLYRQVQRFLVDKPEEGEEGNADEQASRYPDSAVSTAISSNPRRHFPPISSEEEQLMCADFILHAIRFLRSVSLALIALQDESFEAMLLTFTKDYSKEELEWMARECQPITASVLRPIIVSVFRLIRTVRAQHKLPAHFDSTALSQNDSATMPLRTNAVATMADAAAAAAERLPRELQRLSTRFRVLMRIFTELAIIAVTMANTRADVAERRLRVLVFVETRDSAAALMGVLTEQCPFAMQVLRPEVLLGQKNGKADTGNYMTRAQQTALLERFRRGEVQLVLATTVAEEGIDVPDCHVVMRCHHQTELRNIVQSCGRLRKKKTLFISLSDLMNGHPRLGYVMDAIHAFEAMLHGAAQRCRKEEWSLATDELLVGANSPENGNPNSAIFPVNVAPNRNQAQVLTTSETTLLARQRDILLDLQCTFGAEAYCIHRRGFADLDEGLVQVTVLMSIPVDSVSEAVARAAVTCLRDDGRYSVSNVVASRNYVQVIGSAVGGIPKAAQHAFVGFCKNAHQLGLLSSEGRAVPAVSTGSHRAARQDPALAAMHVRCGFTQTGVASLVFLCHSLCLCSSKTWPPCVVNHFSRGRASVMCMYNEDLWKSRVEPQKVLREELSSANGSPPEFRLSAVGGGAAEVEDVGPDSVSEVGSRYYSNTQSLSSTVTRGGESRATSSTLQQQQQKQRASSREESAEVEFTLPLSVVEIAREFHRGLLASSSAQDGSRVATALSANAESTYETESGCTVQEWNVEVPSTDKTGKEKVTRMRRFRIRFCGVHASKVVSLEGLRQLGVVVMYDVNEEELMSELCRCSQVGFVN